MESKFTPGPLTLEVNSKGEWAIVGDGRATAFIPKQHPKALENARLYMASPDLLEALQDLVTRVDKARGILQNPSSPSHGYWGVLDTETAKLAIEKATKL